jgi:protein PhnA
MSASSSAELSTFESILRERASAQCELCGGSEQLAAHLVPPSPEPSADRCVLLCEPCRSQLAAPSADDSRWYCLRVSVWSAVPAVLVLSVRLLRALGAQDWAQDLLGQVYLDEDTQAWADAGAESAEGEAPTLDSNGTALASGDSVTIIKDLDVKGTGFVAKRGTLVKSIRLIEGDPDNIEGRVNKTTLVLKTKFLKKAN